MADDLPAPSERNLIVCCDGTGNQVGVNLSNVLELYRILEEDEHSGCSTIQVLVPSPSIELMCGLRETLGPALQSLRSHART